MKPIFYTLALLILVYWALGVFAWDLGPIVHALVPIAALAVLTGDVYKDGIHR